MRGKKAKALRKLAFAATSGSGNDVATRYNEAPRNRYSYTIGTITLAPTCTRGVYQRLKRHVKAHGMGTAIGALNRAAKRMAQA